MNSEPIRKYWFADDPFRTLFFNSLSVSIPESERFIASTAELALPLVHDEALRKQTENLVHEEKAHTRVHEAYNDLLRKQGYRIEGFELLEKRRASFFAKKGLKFRLALCLCGEFFTAVMGRHLFQNRVCEEEGIDKRMRALWTWHSLEELDHRNAAFDLYLAQGGGYFRRAFAMFLMTALYFSTHIACFLTLLHQDRVHLTLRERLKALGFLLGRRGFYSAVVLNWLSFFKPGFHPKKDIRLEPGLAPELHHFHVEEHFVETVEKSVYA